VFLFVFRDAFSLLIKTSLLVAKNRLVC